MDTCKQGLVIGRFQLVGNNHKDLFDQIKSYHLNIEKVDKLNVGIGVADSFNMKNPFSGAECWQMIKPIAERTAKEMGIPLDYRLVDDIHDPPNYAAHISRIFGFNPQDDLVVFSSNDYTTQCFQSENHTIVEIEERIKQHSSSVRNLYGSGADISELVPPHVPGYLKSIGARQRLAKMIYNNPIPTVDLVIEYENGIVIIERNGDPRGHALPGGHVDYDERVETAAVREAKEETNLDVELKGMIGVYSDPNRDKRGHRISVAYYGIGKGKLKEGSDAKRVYVCSPDQVPMMQFDHNEILEDYFDLRRENV
jgi:ADP-ribose pyrophosphatase YjhB (NUDIX family)/nicotinamide mononucleotide adenylyltransferase